MSRYNDDTAVLALPPPELFAAVPPVREAVENYQRIDTDLQTLWAKLAATREKHQAAVELDRQDRALAVYHAQPDPGTKRSDKLAADIERQEAQIEPHKNGLQDARRALIDVIEEHRGALADAAVERIAGARGEFLAVVDSLEAAQRHAAESFGLEVWLGQFPHKNPRWGSAAFFNRLVSLPTRGGEATTFAVVATALRELGDPPEPSRPVQQHVPPSRQQWGGGRDPIAAQPSVATTVEMGVH